MNAKRFFLLLLVILLISAPLILSHKSQEPVLWRWSPNYLLAIIIYLGFVALILFSYLRINKVGLGFCIYLILMYFLAFVIVDFIIGYMNYRSLTHITSHPIYHHTLLPGVHRLALSERSFLDHKYTITVNSQRVRSTGETSVKKPHDCVRVLALGDSMTEGVGVNDNETSCYLLQDYLNAAGKNDVKYEVINSGVGSYVPILEYLYLKTDGIKFEPDLVILFFDMGDLVQTQGYLTNAIRDEKGNVVKVPPAKHSFLYNLDVFLRSRLYYLGNRYCAAKRMFARKNKITPIDINRGSDKLLKFTLSADQKEWEKEWQRIYEDIGLINDFCKERNIDFAVVIYPWGHQVSAREWPLGRKGFGIPTDYTAPPEVSYMLENGLKERHIPVLNLFPAFRNYKGKERLYYKKDMHWTKEGHRLAARHLFGFLDKKWTKKRQ